MDSRVWEIALSVQRWAGRRERWETRETWPVSCHLEALLMERECVLMIGELIEQKDTVEKLYLIQ